MTDNQCVPGSLLDTAANRQTIDFSLRMTSGLVYMVTCQTEKESKTDFIIYIECTAILELHTLKINVKLIVLPVRKVQRTD